MSNLCKADAHANRVTVRGFGSVPDASDPDWVPSEMHESDPEAYAIACGMSTGNPLGKEMTKSKGTPDGKGPLKVEKSKRHHIDSKRHSGFGLGTKLPRLGFSHS